MRGLATGLLAGAALALAHAPAHAETLAVDLELVIAVDVSASMDRGEFALQREGYRRAIADPAFVEVVRAGPLGRIALTYLEWSGPRFQSVVVPWRIIDDAASARAFADALDSEPAVNARGTSLSAALALAAGLIDANGFEGTRKAIDVSGDGPNNYGGPVTAARDRAVEAGIVINGLPILIRPSPVFPAMDRYYADCVIGGPGSFVLAVHEAAELAVAIRRKLILEVAGRADARLVPVAATEPVDCLIGEKTRARWADPYLPGLDD